MDIKKEIEKSIQSQFGNSGVDGVVNLMQMNYNMHGKAVNVIAAGSEIKIDMLDKDLVDQYKMLFSIIENPTSYSANDINQAKSLLAQYKTNLSQGSPQSAQDKQLFKNAKVTKLTFYIGGLLVTSVSV